MTEPIPVAEEAAAEWLRRAIETLRERSFPSARYQVGKRVREGGQAEVLAVRDVWLRRPLAMKRLPAASNGRSARQLRFLQEAQVASQLSHPGILPVFDLGVDSEDRLFYTTVLLPGTTLWDVLHPAAGQSQRNSSLHRLVSILAQVADTVEFAHQHGVVHRDLKPSNILVGDLGQVYLVDWGSAKVRTVPDEMSAPDSQPLRPKGVETAREDHLAESPDSPDSTRISGFPGTPPFMPPEAFCVPCPELDVRADVYSLGAVLYEILTGRPPYSDQVPRGSEPESFGRAVRRGAPTAIERLARKTPAPLVAICRKAMERDPNNRYQSAGAFAADLRAFLDLRVVSVHRTGPIAELAAWVRRNRAVAALTACLLAATLVGGAQFLRFRSHKLAARQIEALQQAELSGRSGDWRSVLSGLQAAEESGYRNLLQLGLSRMEAYTALAEPDLARTELEKILRLDASSGYAGVVRLKQGEYELFGRGTFEEGLQHVREALELGLHPGDSKFAKGLLAQSTPEALELFQQALELDPFHHGAHRHSLGLEFLLGRKEQLDSHLRVFRVLYPDDPTPSYVQAMRLALSGDQAGALQTLEPLIPKLDPASRRKLVGALHFLSLSLSLWNVESFLSADVEPEPNPILAQLLPLAFSLGSQDSSSESGLRLPQLPSVREGVYGGFRALFQLMFASGANFEASIDAVRAALKAHPEAMFPLTAGMALERWRPADAEELRRFLMTQASLFEAATELPTAFPRGYRLARALAALSQLELGHRLDPPDLKARAACLEHLRWLNSLPQATATEYEVYFHFGFELGELELARELLSRWQRFYPADEKLQRARVEIEIATGALGPALDRVNELLAMTPADPWALDRLQAIRHRIALLEQRAAVRDAVNE